MAELTQNVPFKFEMALDSVSEPSEIKEEGKRYYLQGIASDNLPDKQNQRFSKGFLKTMVDSANGMTCFYEHKRDLDHSIGFCKDAQIEDDSLFVRIQMEDPGENELVKKIIAKNNNGVKIGLSISGVVTKHTIEKSESSENIKTNDEDSGEIQVLEEGRLDEISAVGLPCNPRGWATVIFKSLQKSREVNDMSQEETKETLVEKKDIEQTTESTEEIVEVEKASRSLAQLQQEIEMLKAEEKLAMLKAKQGGSEEEVVEEDEEEEDELAKATVQAQEQQGQQLGQEVALADDVPVEGEVPVDEESASKEDVLMISQEIVNGIGQAISSSMESLNAVMEQLRSAMEGQAVEAEKSLTRIKEKLDYLEKSHYDRIEQMVRSEGDRVESALKNSNEKKSEKLSEEIQKSLDNVQNLLDTDEFKQAIQSSVEESIQNLQRNPSPVRKSQGNKEFNNPDNHVKSDKVDSNSIHPFNVSKAEMEKLNKEERLSVLNRGLSVMTGFSS